MVNWAETRRCPLSASTPGLHRSNTPSRRPKATAMILRCHWLTPVVSMLVVIAGPVAADEPLRRLLVSGSGEYRSDDFFAELAPQLEANCTRTRTWNRTSRCCCRPPAPAASWNPSPGPGSTTSRRTLDRSTRRWVCRATWKAMTFAPCSSTPFSGRRTGMSRRRNNRESFARIVTRCKT